MKDLTIIIPFLNEAANLPRLVEALNRTVASRILRQWPEIRLEVIFVDDGSSDGSTEVLSACPFDGYEARLVRLSRNFGSHAALRAGVLVARSSGAITFLTADLQDPPELTVALYQKFLEGHEIVWARREQTGSALAVDRLFSRLYAWLVRRFALPTFPPEGLDIVLFGPRVRDELNRNIEANSSLFLQILSLGFSQDFVRYRRQQRAAGKSRWTVAKKIKLLIDSFVSFSYAPIRLVSILGFAMAGVGMAWSALVILRALLRHDLEPGWPTLIGVLMIGFGVTNISLGVIAEYLWRTLDASRKRPVFVVQEARSLGAARSEEARA